jgi:Arc/MetJ-type ribon-helix-helix transcriptional regulator
MKYALRRGVERRHRHLDRSENLQERTAVIGRDSGTGPAFDDEATAAGVENGVVCDFH